MKHWVKIFITVFLLGVCRIAAPTAAQARDEAKTTETIDVTALIFGHIGDGYEWHFATIGENHISLYLPVILYSNQSGWHSFSSRNFHHGQASYEGFHIAHGGDYDGKIVETDPVSGADVRPIDLSVTKNVLALLINGALLVCLILCCSRWYKRHKCSDMAPKGFIGLMEMIVNMIYTDVIKANIPQHVQRYAPYLLTAFFFILFNNLIGLLPGSANLTGNIAITFALACFTFLMTNLFGNKEYWKEILWPDVPVALKPLMAVIEIFSMFTKPIALLIRLFANIMAGHTALLALFSLIFITGTMGPALNIPMSILSIFFCLFLNFLELLVAFIQAYIFTILSAVFIGLSQPVHHHHAAGAKS